MNLISPAGHTEPRTVACPKSHGCRLLGDYTLGLLPTESSRTGGRNKINHQGMTVPLGESDAACFTDHLEGCRRKTPSRNREPRISPWTRKPLGLSGPSMLRDQVPTPSEVQSRSNTNLSPDPKPPGVRGAGYALVVDGAESSFGSTPPPPTFQSLP